MKRLKPPAHLGKVEAQMWNDIVKDYGIQDTPGLSLLQQALEAHELARKCREAIDAEGLQPNGKPHGLLVTLRDARKSYATFMRALNFDLEPLQDRVGRPSGSK